MQAEGIYKMCKSYLEQAINAERKKFIDVFRLD